MMKTEKLSKPIVASALACFCCLLWASAFPMIKIGYKLFCIGATDTASQILFAGLRFTIAGILAVLIGSVSSKKFLKPKKGNLKYIVILSLVQTVIQYVFFYIGLAGTGGANASVLNSSSVFFSIIASAIFFKGDRLTAKKLLGCAVGFAGIVIMNFGNLKQGFNFFGDGFIIISAISYAMSSVLIKNFSRFENPVTLSGWQFIFGGASMSIAGLLFGGNLSAESLLKAVLVLIYLGFLSAGAYSIWGILLKYNEISAISVFGFVTPIGGVIMSALILGEKINPIKYIPALILVSIGIILVNFNFGRKKDGRRKERNQH